MGCLYVEVAAPSPCTIHIVEDSEQSLEASVIALYSELNVESIEDFFSCYVALDNLNADINISTQAKNVIPTVTVALVCRISTGEWLYLHVLEGNIITIDGNYIQVLKG